ncbi:hypothetical protein [Streptomyces sp. NPDC001404]|uniref:hypothetical protein n=1 Tax=Streptomyces sp. NPDC001404 TaxID=3364571 RepID=UPI0036B1044A
MSHRPIVHYIATRPDGTVPPTCGSAAEYAHWIGEPIPTVNLAAHLGQAVDHPDPGRRWYDDSPFSYFRMYTKPGEILERVQWPARLFVVEPRGETGNWGAPHYPYWALSHQLKVIEETEAWRAFGHRGDKVLDVIDRQLPELARQWAEEWAADPDGTRQRYDAWSERLNNTGALSDWVYWKACSSRRAAAAEQAQFLARTAAEKSAAAVLDDLDAVAVISRRAQGLTAAELLHDRLRRSRREKEILALLRGVDVDTPQSAAA